MPQKFTKSIFKLPLKNHSVGIADQMVSSLIKEEVPESIDAEIVGSWEELGAYRHREPPSVVFH